MEEILKVNNISKRYEDITVFENMNLSVKKGEVVVIVGPSGCGKSTFLRCLNALENIQEGDIILDGKTVSSDQKDIVQLRERVGMVFQSYELFPHLTVLQNLMLAPVKVKKRNKKASGRRIYPYEYRSPDLPDRERIHNRTEDPQPPPGTDEIAAWRSGRDGPGGRLPDGA